MAINSINSVQHKWNSNFKFAYLSFIVNGFLCESLRLSTNMANRCLYRSKLKSISFVLSIDIVRIESVDWNLSIEFDISIFVGDFLFETFFDRVWIWCLFAVFFFSLQFAASNNFSAANGNQKSEKLKRNEAKTKLVNSDNVLPDLVNLELNWNKICGIHLKVYFFITEWTLSPLFCDVHQTNDVKFNTVNCHTQTPTNYTVFFLHITHIAHHLGAGRNNCLAHSFFGIFAWSSLQTH